MSAAEELRSALASLQADPSARNAAAWRVVLAYARTHLRFAGLPYADHDDVRQEALTSIARSIGQLRADTAAGAAAWVWRIFRHRAIDARRVATRERSRRDGADVEELGGPVVEHRDEDTVEALAAVLAELDRHVAEVPGGTARSLRTRHARVAVGRLVFGLDAGELADALGLETAPKASTLDTWVSRGRGVVLAALERWLAEADGDERVEAIVEVLRETMTEGRADAGVPRARRSAA